MKTGYLRNLGHFFKEVRRMLTSPFFVILTVMGNGMIGLCSLVFYHLESGVNPKVVRHMDALWWSFATATTTGYGDITPVTDAGKVLSILLMLMGLALFSMYTALFADTILVSKEHMKSLGRKED